MVFVLLGCTLDAGRGFGELTQVTLDADLEPGEARDLGDGAILTNLAYEVTPTVATLGLGTVSLLELQGGAGGDSFDPADPPEGYGLCHGGHCHRDDGALVDYADVEAELAGGGASFAAVATIPIGQEVDLLGGASLELVPTDPTLPAADVSKLTLGVGTLHIEALVSDGIDGGWPLTVDLALDGDLAVGFDLALDRDHDPVVQLALALQPGGTLLDDLDFAALAVEGAVHIADDADPGAETLAAACLAVEPTFTVDRQPWSD